MYWFIKNIEFNIIGNINIIIFNISPNENN